MSRVTISDLREAVSRHNGYQVADLCIDFVVEQGRNGYQAIDHYVITEDGRLSCNDMIQGGSSRECIGKLHSLRYDNKVKTREQARAFLCLVGVDFSSDYHELSYWECDMIHDLAKLTKYRKPKKADGSLARCFFKHLQRSKYAHIKEGAHIGMHLRTKENA